MTTTDDTVIDDSKKEGEAIEVKGRAPTLDEVHELNRNKLEADDANADGNGDESAADDDGDKVAGADEGKGDDGKGAGTADADAADAGKQDDSNNSGEAVSKEETPPAKVDKPAVELDIHKNAAGKVAIKNSLGETLYFNTFDEIPDDFEPDSYSALMRGTKALFQKEQDDAKAADEEKASEAKAAHDKATQDLMAGWSKEADALVTAGKLPKDTKEREAVTKGVYDYMESELQKGNLINSFTQAYKSYMFDKQEQDSKDKQKEINDAKKKRGGMVQGGSTGGKTTATSHGGRVIEGPPAGVGLDAIHNRAVNSL